MKRCIVEHLNFTR